MYIDMIYSLFQGLKLRVENYTLVKFGSPFPLLCIFKSKGNL